MKDKIMKKPILIAAIFIVLALLFTLAPASPVMASPLRIEDPGFEATDNWTYYTDDTDYNGAYSTNWTTQGTYSYQFWVSVGSLPNGKYAHVAQTVDLTLVDTISFDVYGDSDQADKVHAHVMVAGVEIWSLTLPTTTTEYLHQEIDLSGYTGSQSLEFGVEVHATANNVTLNVYFDNIKIWGSYSDEARTVVDNYFSGGENIVYMYGENFDASTAYHIGYYDGDGAKILSDGVNSTSDGELCSQCYFPAYQATAVPGTWHAVVCKDSVASPPETYIPSDPDRVVEDSFEVTAAAIPEFTTVLAAIAVAGLCFGIYYWMRRRYVRFKVQN